MRRSRLAFVVPRVGRPSARARPAASRDRLARRLRHRITVASRVVGAVLAELTTLRLGGPAARVAAAHGVDELVDIVRSADAAGEPVLILGGGSNLVVGDDGWDGVVVLVRCDDVDVHDPATTSWSPPTRAMPWDDARRPVRREGWSGLAAMSGIPGLTGATPVQNVGAYGSEVADVIAGLDVLDRQTGDVEHWDPELCGFGFRTSAFKHTDRYVVLRVSFRLARSPLAPPVRYLELARRLGIEPGAGAPSAQVREVVLALRRSKGMVLDPDDHDTWSVGSFFVNPFVAPDARAGRLPALGRRRPAIKLSAAWLIENAGFGKGYGLDVGAGRVGGLDQAHPGPHQPGRRDHCGAARAGPRHPGRRRGPVRRPAASRGPSGGRAALRPRGAG